MTISIDLNDDEQKAVERAAKERDMDVGDFVRSLILPVSQSTAEHIKNGAELVAYWQREGLIGTRKNIDGSEAHARKLRDQAQRRSRTS